MTDREKDLVNRYIYEVTKRVFKEQRSEIEMELKELIADMEETMTAEQIFTKLGDPAVFARKYREDENYVIGPDYYDNYVWVLKIVFISIWASLILSLIVQSIINYQNILYQVAAFFNDIIVASLAAFGSVTLIFAILERQKIKIDIKQKKVWTPDMLSPISDIPNSVLNKKARISRGDCIASIIFIILFSCLMAFAPQLIGAYSIYEEEVLSVAVFNLEQWNIILPFFLIAMSACLIDEIIRLIAGRYCRKVLYSSIGANIIQIVCGIILTKVLPIWNVDFVQEITAMFDDNFRFKGELIGIWNPEWFGTIILAVIVASAFVEVGVMVYKTVRYGSENN